MYGDEHVVQRHFLRVVPYKHHGIELPDGTMCENSPPGVRIVTYADFARDRPTVVVNPDATEAERAQAVQRALSRVGEHRYSLTGNNCEHFTTWCATGVAISRQVIACIQVFAQLVRTAFTVACAYVVLRAALAD